MSSADANVSTENQDPWKDRKGNYKPFYFAMILLMTWGGFALLSGIYFIVQSRRSNNNYQSLRADALEVPPDRFPVAEMDRTSSRQSSAQSLPATPRVPSRQSSEASALSRSATPRAPLRLPSAQSLPAPQRPTVQRSQSGSGWGGLYDASHHRTASPRPPPPP